MKKGQKADIFASDKLAENHMHSKKVKAKEMKKRKE